MDAAKKPLPENPPPDAVGAPPSESVIGRWIRGFLQGTFGLIASVVFWCRESWRKLQDLSGTNYELGVRHLKNGKLVDAVFRFRLVLRMTPEHPLAWYHLGRAWLRRGKIEKGCDALRKALELGGYPEEAKFLLACADERFPLAQAPGTMPLSLITDYFDFVAPVYGTMQREQFDYRGHRCAYEAAFSQLKKEETTLRILDLGAASGMVAELFRPHALKIIGVDVSRGMAAVADMARDARGQPIFDEYHNVDFRRYLKEHTQERFTLVLAEEVLGHLGDLQDVFKDISELLSARALFVFSTEPSPDPGYVLKRELARFGHSADYVRRLADSCRMKEVYFKEAELYPRHKVHQWAMQKA